jgi:hypothetical protein
MKEKIFLKKSSRPGKSLPTSFFQFRNLFKFGIILLFWIAFIPLLWHQKTKNADDKVAPAKVMKEMPKGHAPASNVEGGAQPGEAVPQVPPVTDKAAVPHPGEKAEVAKATGATSGQERGPQEVRREDAAKPPIGPVPEVRPMPAAGGAPTVTREPAGEAPVERPTTLSKELLPDKTKPGLSTKPDEKPKPAGSAVPGEKPKPGPGLASVDKPKPGAATVPAEKPKPGAGAGSGATTGTTAAPATAKVTSPKTQQPQAATAPTKPSTQTPPTTATSGDRPKTPATMASKPPTPASPSVTPQAAPGTPPSAAADKAKEPPGGINWVYIVRLGSFQNPTQAQELQKQLQQKGYAVAVKSHQNLQKGKVYHVDLKAVRDAAAAKAQMDKLQKEEKVNPVLLKVTETR